MESDFSFLDCGFFTKAAVFPGSIGTFRYRFKRDGGIGEGSIQAWVYENVCFELARDVETAAFDWTESGVEALRAWLLQKLKERGSEPYRIPYLPERAEEG